MSLLDANKVACVVLKRNHAADGEGGQTVEWAEGTSFQAAITLDSSTEARRAEGEDVKNRYTVTLTRSLDLKYHDVFKRKDDGRVFRVTSDGKDKKTPKGAGLDMRQVTAEEWTLT